MRIARRFVIPCLIAILLAPAAARAADKVGALLDLGELHLRKRNFSEAEKYFRQAAAADDGCVYAHLGIQEALRRAGKEDGLPSRYEDRLVSDPESTDCLFLFARLLEPEAALERMKKASRPTFFLHLARARAYRELEESEAGSEIAAAEEKCPEEPRALCLVAGYHEDAGSYGKAVELYERALKLDASRIDSLVGLANSLRRKGDLDRALQVILRAEAIDGEDPEILYRKGLLYHDRHESALARKAYEASLGMAKDSVEVVMAWGEAHLQDDEYAKAEEKFRIATDLAPRRADARRRLAFTCELQDKNDEALEAYEHLVRLDPFDAAANIGLGWINLKKGKFEKAVKEFRQASDKDPESVLPFFFIGYAEDLRGRWGDAADAYERAIRMDEEFAPAHNNLGLDQDLLGKSRRAIRSLQTAVELDPENIDYILNLGNAYYNAKKYKDALERFADVVELDEKVLYGWTGLARCQKQLRRYGLAAEAYEKAIELAPEEIDLHLVVGILYDRELKDYEKALDHYETYLKLGGMDPGVQAWVDELKKKLK